MVPWVDDRHYSMTYFPKKDWPMLMTIAIVLLVLWALGLIGGYAAGGLVHLLLVIALIMLIVQFASGRRVL
jgi:hypothetical protein